MYVVQNVGPNGDTRLKKRIEDFVKEVCGHFLVALRQYCDHYNQQITDQSSVINQLDQQLTREISNAVHEVINEILDQIE